MSSACSGGWGYCASVVHGGASEILTPAHKLACELCVDADQCQFALQRLKVIQRTHANFVGARSM